MSRKKAAAGPAVPRYWAPFAAEGFAQADLVRELLDDKVELLVHAEGGDEKLTVAKSALLPLNPSDQNGVEDNTQLMYLHDAGLLHNVKARFLKDQIYTYTGYILIAVNPYKTLPNVYGPSQIQAFKGKSIGKMPPHIYAIADRAYRDMKANSRNQSLIVSGESGAGKTESCKYIMRYLTAVGGANATEAVAAAASPGGRPRGLADLEDRILVANPLLEAFGNAKTTRNNNSSRFGKFTELHFDKDAKLVGASIVTYLLEKSRVVHQNSRERNYHIFYQLVMGASPAERETFLMSDMRAEQFACLTNKDSLNVNGVDDAAGYQGVRDAMTAIGMPPEEQINVLRMVAGVMQLGNVEFYTFKNKEDANIKEDSMRHVQSAANLFGVSSTNLSQFLTTRTMKKMGRRNSITVVPLKTEDAVNARNAMAKAVYVRLFDWLVERINQSLPLRNSANYIGVLDIAGFEFFDRNSFEQFCINFANEKLQQHFNVQVFAQEQEIYAREALEFTKVEFQDNTGCLDLIEARTTGILSILDEEQRMPGSNDKHFGEQIYLLNKDNKHLKSLRAARLRTDEAFCIGHFAGDVAYHVDGFLAKNNDNLPGDLTKLLENSEDAFVRQLFNPGAKVVDPDDIASIAQPTRKRVNSSIQVNSVGGKFKSQLKDLMDKLQSTSSNFVRCVKPTDLQKPGIFDGRLVMHQLRCSGMMEVLQLMQKGYPTRCPFDLICERYKSMMPAQIQNLSPPTFCEALLVALDLNHDDFKVGLTRVFFRAGKMAFLDELTAAGPTFTASVVARVKHWLIRKQWRRVYFAVISGLRWNRHLRMMRAATKWAQITVRVTTFLRPMRAALRRARRRLAIIRLQAFWRMYRLRKRFRLKRKRAIKVQSFIRRWAVYRLYKDELAARNAERKARPERERKEKEKREREELIRKRQEQQEKAAAAAELKARQRRNGLKATAVAVPPPNNEVEELKLQIANMQRGAATPTGPGSPMAVDTPRADPAVAPGTPLVAMPANMVMVDAEAAKAATTLKAEVEEVRSKLGETEAARTSLQQMLTETKENLERQTNEARAVKEAAAAAQAACATANERIASLDKLLKEQAAALADEQKQRTDAREQVVRIEEKLAEQRVLSQAAIEKATKERDDLAAQMRQALEDARAATHRLEEELARVRVALATAEAERDAVRRRIDEELTTSRAEVSAQRAAADEARNQLNESRARLAVLQVQVEEKNAKVAGLVEELDYVSKAKTELRGDLQFERTQRQAAQKEIEDIKRLAGEGERMQREKVLQLETTVERLKDEGDKRRSQNFSDLLSISSIPQHENSAMQAQVTAMTAKVEQRDSRIAQLEQQLAAMMKKQGAPGTPVGTINSPAMDSGQKRRVAAEEEDARAQANDRQLDRLRHEGTPQSSLNNNSSIMDSPDVSMVAEPLRRRDRADSETSGGFGSDSSDSHKSKSSRGSRGRGRSLATIELERKLEEAEHTEVELREDLSRMQTLNETYETKIFQLSQLIAKRDEGDVDFEEKVSAATSHLVVLIQKERSTNSGLEESLEASRAEVARMRQLLKERDEAIDRLRREARVKNQLDIANLASMHASTDDTVERLARAATDAQNETEDLRDENSWVIFYNMCLPYKLASTNPNAVSIQTMFEQARDQQIMQRDYASFIRGHFAEADVGISNALAPEEAYVNVRRAPTVAASAKVDDPISVARANTTVNKGQSVQAAAASAREAVRERREREAAATATQSNGGAGSSGSKLAMPASSTGSSLGLPASGGFEGRRTSLNRPASDNPAASSSGSNGLGTIFDGTRRGSSTLQRPASDEKPAEPGFANRRASAQRMPQPPPPTEAESFNYTASGVATDERRQTLQRRGAMPKDERRSTMRG